MFSILFFFQIVLTCPLKVTALPLNMDFKLGLFTQTRKRRTKSVYQNLLCGECRPVEESWRTTSIMYVWWRLCCHSSTSWSASKCMVSYLSHFQGQQVWIQDLVKLSFKCKGPRRWRPRSRGLVVFFIFSVWIAVWEHGVRWDLTWHLWGRGGWI